MVKLTEKDALLFIDTVDHLIKAYAKEKCVDYNAVDIRFPCKDNGFFLILRLI